MVLCSVYVCVRDECVCLPPQRFVLLIHFTIPKIKRKLLSRFMRPARVLLEYNCIVNRILRTAYIYTAYINTNIRPSIPVCYIFQNIVTLLKLKSELENYRP